MRFLLCLFITISINVSAFAETEFYYRIQKDDSITVVLYSLGIFPVWNELPRVLKINELNVQKNPDYLTLKQKIILPKPNPIFQANYKILADGEIIIISKIRTQKQKEDFLNKRELREVIPLQEPKKSIITKKNEDNLLPRQIERVYINYGFLLNATSSEQKLSKRQSISGTNSLQSTNIGVSAELALKSKHHFYFDVQKFILPVADATMFSNNEFNLMNLSYFYGVDLSQRTSILLGINHQERIFFTDISQTLIEVNKTNFLTPSLGGMYFFKSKIFSSTPRIAAHINYRPEKELAGKTINAAFEFSLLAGAFYNIDQSSHIEVSLGADYKPYQIDEIEGQDLAGKIIVKYGQEYFF